MVLKRGLTKDYNTIYLEFSVCETDVKIDCDDSGNSENNPYYIVINKPNFVLSPFVFDPTFILYASQAEVQSDTLHAKRELKRGEEGILATFQNYIAATNKDWFVDCEEHTLYLVAKVYTEAHYASLCDARPKVLYASKYAMPSPKSYFAPSPKAVAHEKFEEQQPPKEAVPPYHKEICMPRGFVDPCDRPSTVDDHHHVRSEIKSSSGSGGKRTKTSPRRSGRASKSSEPKELPSTLCKGQLIFPNMYKFPVLSTLVLKEVIDPREGMYLLQDSVSGQFVVVMSTAVYSSYENEAEDLLDEDEQNEPVVEIPSMFLKLDIPFYPIEDEYYVEGAGGRKDVVYEYTDSNVFDTNDIDFIRRNVSASFNGVVQFIAVDIERGGSHQQSQPFRSGTSRRTRGLPVQTGGLTRSVMGVTTADGQAITEDGYGYDDDGYGYDDDGYGYDDDGYGYDDDGYGGYGSEAMYGSAELDDDEYQDDGNGCFCLNIKLA